MAVFNQIPLTTVKNNRIHVDDPLAIEKVYATVMEMLAQYDIPGNRPVVLLCIGTDRSTGDCLGPLVGSQLSREQQQLFQIYGTLDHPAHAGNLQDFLDEINSKHQNAFVIALDACLGNLDNVGYISIGTGSLQPGAGVNKSLPKVGDMYITGIVNVGGFMEYLVLQNTRLNLVMKMAGVIAGGLSKVAGEMWCEKARTV